MLITRVAISNFQSLRHVTLDFGPYVSLIGPSDVGKSAVWRALHAALTNRTGESYIRHGKKACRVTLDLADGTRIEWEKARGKSGVYHLDIPGQAVRVFEKTNGEVPSEVRALLNVSVEVAGEPLTPGLQGQHDRPFLLADTPRRRAQILGEFDGSNIALAAETVLRTSQRAAQTALRTAEQQAEAADATLRAYDGLPVALAAYEASVAAAEAHGAASERVTRLRGLLTGARVSQRTAQGYSATAAALTLPAAMPSVDDIERRAQRLAAQRQAIARGRFMGAAALTDERLARGMALPASTPALLALVAAGTARTERLRVALFGASHHHRRAEAARVVLAGAPPPALAEVDGLRERGERLARLRGLFVRAVGTRDTAASDAGAALGLADLEAEARRALAGLAGSVCPECGQTMTAEVTA